MTRIYFAGAKKFVKELQDVGVDSVLYNYYYLKNKIGNEDFKETFISPFKHILIDSGGYTFRKGGGGKVKSKEFYEDLHKEYINFICKYNDDLDGFFELDVDDAIGQEPVDNWYEQWRDIGLSPIRVWHKKQGVNRLNELVEQVDFLGVTSRGKNKPLSWFKMIEKKTKENNCNLHGLGVTSVKLLDKIDFDTVDSTAWNAGGRYGVFYYFDKGTIKLFDKNKFSEKFKNKAFRKLPREEITKWNLIQWKKYSDYLQEDKI